MRLRQNVIKTGIRRLSLSYSRISLRDICVKLHLDSEEDAEYIVGKAIRDGVIEGRIVHEKGWMECGGQKSGYGPEVSDVFARRISYCLELHNQSVKVRGSVLFCPVLCLFSVRFRSLLRPPHDHHVWCLLSGHSGLPSRCC